MMHMKSLLRLIRPMKYWRMKKQEKNMIYMGKKAYKKILENHGKAITVVGATTLKALVNFFLDFHELFIIFIFYLDIESTVVRTIYC